MLTSPIRAECPAFALRYGHARTPLVLVVPDTDWPGMWRIACPDGQLSDLVNLTRAKDAAEVISEHGPPVRDRRRFNWHRLDSPSGAAPARQMHRPLPQSFPPAGVAAAAAGGVVS
jgi:hypothetical protein